MKKFLVPLVVTGLLVVLGIVAFVRFNEPGARQPDGVDPAVPSADHTPAGSLRGTWLGGEVADWRPPHTLARLSAAVYDGEDVFRAEAAALGFDPGSVRWVGSGHLQAAVVSTGPADGRVTVAVFRGTSTFGELLDDIDFVGRPLGPSWRVHKGFLNALVPVEDGVAREVREQNPVHLWATGHSLGGAMAGLFAAKRLRAGLPAPRTVTFGQPAFGDWALVDDLNNDLGGDYVRVIFEDDPVTRLAPGFHHAGRVVRFRGERDTLYQMPAPGTDGAPPIFPGAGGGFTHEVDAVEPPMFTEEEVRRLREDIRAEDNPPVFGDAGRPRVGTGGSWLVDAWQHRMRNYTAALADRTADQRRRESE